MVSSSKRSKFFAENPGLRIPYEALKEELAAGFARQLKAAELADHRTESDGCNATEEYCGQSERMARKVLNGYITGLMSHRDSRQRRHLPPGLSQNMCDLAQSLVVVANRARRVWSNLPPGPSLALAGLGQWSQDTVKLAEMLSEKKWLPKDSGKWNVVDEAIWGFLKSTKRITGGYHYGVVAKLTTLCLDDPNDRYNVASLKMIVYRRKAREAKFLQVLGKLEEEQKDLVSKLARPSTPPRKRSRKR